MKASLYRLSFLLTFVGVNFSPAYAQTRTITPALDGTGTVINQQGNQFEINGGSVSGDGQNLFHSFEQFNLSEGQVANFLSNPNIRNILGRVVGGDASFINGLIQVTGGNSNLFLMNPAGMVFGANASLNVPAAFTATTANGIGFGTNSWFNIDSNSDWSALVGTPNSFRFDTQNPGSIINIGQLAVNSGQQLTLVAGTVINAGTLAAPEGRISVQTVPGENLVRIAQDGHLLNLEVTALPNNSLTQSAFKPLSLPQLLTGGNATTATGVIVNNQGEIVLTSGQTVEAGDIAVIPQFNNNNNLAVAGETVTLKAANTLTLVERSLQTTGDLKLIAGNTVRVRDSLTQPFSAEAGGNLQIVGVQNIDILALDSINLLNSAPFQAGGNLTLASDGIVSGDSHFSAGGNFSILNSTGAGGVFLSLYDPIIYSDGDVVFGSYEGASLKVEATGAILGGDINITTPDITLEGSTDPDAGILSSSPALILRSGVTTLSNDVNIEPNTSVEGTDFLNRPASGNNDLTVGNVITAGGPVILNATGRIVVDQINTQGGEVNLQAVDNIIVARNINSAGGNIEIITDNFLRVGTLIDPRDNIPSISSTNDQADGSINIEHGGGETPFIIGDATTNGTAKSITSRSSQIPPQFAVPRSEDGVFTQGNITIRTTPLASAPPVETPTPPPEEPPTEPTPPPDGTPPDELPTEPTPAPDGTPPEEPPTEPTPPPDGTPPEEPPTEPTPPPDGTPPNEPPTEPTPPTQIPRIEDPPIEPTPVPVPTPTPIAPLFPTPIPPTPAPTPVPPPTNAPSEVPSPTETETETLSPSQQEEVTTVVEAELVNRKNRSSLPENRLRNGNIANNSILEVSGIRTEDSQTLSVQQNADGSVALNRSNPTKDLVIPLRTSEVSELDAEEQIELARLDITASLDNNNLEESVANIEEAYSLDYLNYIGKNISDFETDISVQEIQDNLDEVDKKYNTKAAIVYIFSQQNELIVMAITAQGEVVQKTITSVDREQVLEVANQFRLEITDARKRYTENYKPLAQKLYQWILTPLEEELESQNIDTLLFVMDRGLRSLPLAALHNGEQFLIEKYNFSLIPSFSLVHIRNRPLNDPRVLAMGASTFDEKPPLPAVPIEVQSITQEIQGSYFLNEDFTIKNFRNQRSNQSFNVIHLATHSEFNAGDSSNSYIQFWDNRLTVDNLKYFGWKWDTPPAELFVLSACRTAVGDEKAELGFAGLAIQAGVPSALASLWYVSDQGTLGLMVEFYNQLREKSTISQSFRAAQIAMIKGEITIESGYLMSESIRDKIPLPDELMNQGNIIFNHPYYWAGFTLIGSPW